MCENLGIFVSQNVITCRLHDFHRVYLKYVPNNSNNPLKIDKVISDKDTSNYCTQFYVYCVGK
jgi:hypothetical protein